MDVREERPLVKPWLVAVWPGMGQVAALAGAHLAEALDPQPAGMIPEREFFSVDHVEVRNGIARAGALPRSMLFVYRHPRQGRDLILFVGEAQPPERGYDLCSRIIDFAKRQGVERVITFAAMGTQLHPASDPSVFGAVTAPSLLKEIRDLDIELLKEGQVGGLNGAMLAAAAEDGIPAVCLLGEMPFFAAGAPNPKAARAVLEVFGRMTGLEIDLARLTKQAEIVEPQLIQLLEQLQTQASASSGSSGPPPREGEEEPVRAEESQGASDGGRLDLATRLRIEELFETARRDRARAVELKAELDRLGVFAHYEDRFLDLFRKAG